MNFPELFECDYSTYNIYSLNEELKKLNKITGADMHKRKNWNHLQQKEYTQLLSYLNEKYPTRSRTRAIPTHEVESNTAIKKQRCNDLIKKIYRENMYYYNKKEELIEKINKCKTLLLANSKDKKKEKALEDIVCECGALSKRKNISTHKKSALHLKRLEKKELCVVIQEPIKEIVKPSIKEVIPDDFEIDFESESEDEPEDQFEDDDEEEKENRYYNMPLIVTEEREEEFRELYDVKWFVKLIIKKDIEWRKKWYKDNDVLFPIYKLDEHGNETKEVIGIK
jgi:hypothetical protein